MGSLGEDVRGQIRALISDPNIKTPITLQTITRTTGSRGGYDGVTETVTSSVSVDSVPSNYIPKRISPKNLGDLQEGELRLLIRDDQTIDTNDKVSFRDDTYHIREVRKIPFNEIIVAQLITLSKVQ